MTTKTFKTIFFVLLMILVVLALYLVIFKLSLFGLMILGANETTINKTNEVIGNFDGVNIHTLNLDEIADIGEPAIPVLVEMLKNDSADVRWAAIMGLSAIGHEYNLSNKILSHLEKALEDNDINVRVTASSLILSHGSKEGIPILISELENEAILKPSEPPSPINAYAVLVLESYTDKDFNLNKTQWQEWWDANNLNLKWNKENEKFTL